MTPIKEIIEAMQQAGFPAEEDLCGFGLANPLRGSSEKEKNEGIIAMLIAKIQGKQDKEQ